MRRTEARNVVLALERLGCKDVSRYAVGADVHVCGTEPSGDLVYVQTVAEAQSAIARLAALRVRR